MENRKVVYTVNFGNYDLVLPVPKFKGWDFILITDKPVNIKGWINRVDETGDSVESQRKLKINSHWLFLEYDVVIYHDASFTFRKSPDEFLKHVGYKGGFMTCKHQKRNNVIDEAHAIFDQAKDSHIRIATTINTLTNTTRMPPEFGLWETGSIIRDNSQDVKILNSIWYEYLKIGSHRDQLSLPFASFESGVKIHEYTRPDRDRFFKVRPHLKR